MIKILTLSEIDQARFDIVTSLWEVTKVGNPARGDTLQAVQTTLANGAKIILAFNDEMPAGTVWLTHDFRRLYIHHMAVHPDFQKLGIGKQMLKTALQVAKELGLQAKLEVHQDNAVAYDLYTKAGFVPLEGYLTLIKRDI